MLFEVLVLILVHVMQVNPVRALEGAVAFVVRTWVRAQEHSSQGEPDLQPGSGGWTKSGTPKNDIQYIRAF